MSDRWSIHTHQICDINKQKTYSHYPTTSLLMPITWSFVLTHSIKSLKSSERMVGWGKFEIKAFTHRMANIKILKKHTDYGHPFIKDFRNERFLNFPRQMDSHNIPSNYKCIFFLSDFKHFPVMIFLSLIFPWFSHLLTLCSSPTGFPTFY